MQLNFGYSPCPNDTFMFWAWAHRHVNCRLELTPQLADIQELNRLALERAAWHLTKTSIPAYLDPKVQEHYRLLSVGAALGTGCGPLVISKAPWQPGDKPLRVAIPGKNTTAFYLAQMAMASQVVEWTELRYDEIMPAVLDGVKVDAGVIIHESRFSYQGLGLHLAVDLGEWWETNTGLPLPLGVMLARRDLDESTVEQCEATLRASIELAWKALDGTHPLSESLWSYLRDNAIELDDTTIRSHIELYVTNYSSDLGSEGRRALDEFARRYAAVTAS